jgi:hypothetical protein
MGGTPRVANHGTIMGTVGVSLISVDGDMIIPFRGDELAVGNFTKAQFDIGDFAG